MANFKIKTVLPGFKRLFGMTAEVYNEAGEILQSVELNNSRKRFSFKFNKKNAFQGSKKAELSIKLIDNNGDDFNFSAKGGKQFDLDADEQTFTASIRDNKKRGRAKLKPSNVILDAADGNPTPKPENPDDAADGNATPKPENPDDTAPVFTSGKTGSIDENVELGTLVYDADATDASALSFTLSGGDSSDFTINSETGQVTINQSPDFETKPLYSFNVVATDAQGNSTKQDVDISVNDIEEAKTIILIPGLDTITANNLTDQDDLVTAELGTLGVDFEDSIFDGSTSDNDLLTLETNFKFNIFESLNSTKINRIQNIETIQINANNDDAGGDEVILDIDKIINLKKLDVDGTFTVPLQLDNWEQTGATEFDFSGITTSFGVLMLEANANEIANSAPLTIKGSAGGDFLQGVNNGSIIQGFAGADSLTAPAQGNAVLEGGAGKDSLSLGSGQYTIRLNGQTSEISKDTVIGGVFQGFNELDAKATNTFDLIEIDAATFSNYTANKAVQQLDIDDVLLGTNLSNTVVEANTQAELETQNFDNNGNGILGFAGDTGILFYSESGDFTADAQALLDLSRPALNFVPVQQINVV